MTAFNREKYIAEAIISVLKSTYNNFELIIVDDCSDDHTVNIARDYALVDTRISVYENEKNLGDYLNRNKAASFAKGKYLKYLDSDDLILPWGLEIMVYCMEKCPKAALGLMSYNEFNHQFPEIISPISAYRNFYFKSKLLHMGPSGAIIRNEIFQTIGGFSGRQFVGDTELWLKIAQKNNIVLMPPALIFWREHEGQQIAEERKLNTVEAIRFDLDLKILADNDCPLLPNEVKNATRNLKNIKCRKLIKNFFRCKFRSAFNQTLAFKLTLSDFAFSIYKNKI